MTIWNEHKLVLPPQGGSGSMSSSFYRDRPEDFNLTKEMYIIQRNLRNTLKKDEEKALKRSWTFLGLSENCQSELDWLVWFWNNRSLTGHHKILIITQRAKPSAAQSASTATVLNLLSNERNLFIKWEIINWSLYKNSGAGRELMVDFEQTLADICLRVDFWNQHNTLSPFIITFF